MGNGMVKLVYKENKVEIYNVDGQSKQVITLQKVLKDILKKN